SATIGAPTTTNPVNRPAPIIALFPYEGVYDPAQPSGRVVVQLRDFELLQSLADLERAPKPAAVTATTATHRVALKESRLAIVESRFELISPGGTGAIWTFPIEGSREISATIDGIDA